MKLVLSQKCVKNTALEFSVFFPHISIGKIKDVEVGEKSSTSIISFPTKLSMIETKTSFRMRIRIVGFGIELFVREVKKDIYESKN